MVPSLKIKMKRRVFILKVISALTIASLMHFSHAADNLHVITENWVPYNYEVEGEIVGDATVHIKKVLKRSGVNYDMTLYPWSRAYKIALNKKNVLIYSLVRMPVREKLFVWSRRILDTEFSSLYRLSARDDIQVNELRDIQKYKIGVIQDSMNYHYLMGLEFNTELLPVSTDQKLNINNLLQGHIDMFAASDKSFSQLRKQMGLSDAVFKQVIPIFKIDPYMAFSKGTSAELIKKINQAYDDLVAEGEIPEFH